MAIYHLEAKIVSRGAGRSAVAAAAYLSCSRMLNEYDGVQHLSLIHIFHSENDSPLYPLLLSRCRAGCRGKSLISGLFSPMTTKTTEK